MIINSAMVQGKKLDIARDHMEKYVLAVYLSTMSNWKMKWNEGHLEIVFNYPKNASILIHFFKK